MTSTNPLALQRHQDEHYQDRFIESLKAKAPGRIAFCEAERLINALVKNWLIHGEPWFFQLLMMAY